MVSYLNDRFIINEDVFINISDLSVQRGYAVFDFFRVMNGVPLFMQDHLDRFYSSAAAMHLPVSQSKEELTAILNELIKKADHPQVGIRIMLSGGYSADGYKPAKPNLLITCKPVRIAAIEDFEKGYSVITYPHQRELPHIKSINYQMGVWLQPLLKEKQADDVLYLNGDIITEFPRSNVFIISEDDILMTPKKNILYGITRKKILSFAADIITVEEKDVTLSELKKAREVFLTSTTKRILPVVKLDGKIIGNGNAGRVTKMLYHRFLNEEQVFPGLIS